MATKEQLEGAIARAESAGDVVSANILRKQLNDADTEQLVSADQDAAD